jgi:hypothetical protein
MINVFNATRKAVLEGKCFVIDLVVFADAEVIVIL